MSTLEVIVATIGRAHGLRGEVALTLRTDQPEERLQDGTAFAVEVGGRPRTLTVAGTRLQQDRWYVRFAEVSDRTDAESLRGIDLALAVDEEVEADEDPDAWYPSQLEGLAVRHVDGRELGTVTGIEHYPAQDLLVVRTPDRRRVQLPLVEQLVPEVDLEAGVVLADPPGGLFEALPEGEQGPDPETSAPPRSTR
ncbi:ribosome maturation factor RimM [Brachybacterium saurashtrense]|uniref:Ribosome maturation factor RimM n=1 Tax=Brachybacterium saurashtrense TaxID=556288 RepID=A0A345YKV6_9MICO|nr:ribosome maturation factor RimM [Brachybacterium saurashtrense]AXK44558.1 ribosome maturation factor RimM [Brachybacterium saurashtrense]RRR23170.1 ribosome maturation factor RimM [Brachybacterium saurashtrense]